MNDRNLIIECVNKYPLAFKEMDTSLIDQYFCVNATKTGFLYDHENKSWFDLSAVGLQELKDWVLVHNKNQIMPESEAQVNILDMESRTAVVKIELEWVKNQFGTDYLFLVKENEKWLIDKILWQSKI